MRTIVFATAWPCTSGIGLTATPAAACKAVVNTTCAACRQLLRVPHGLAARSAVLPASAA